VKVYFCPLLPYVRSNIALYEGFEASPSCPFDISSIKVDMDMEHSRNDDDRGNRSIRRNPYTSTTFTITDTL
jgi:hypothetical protein